MNSTSPLEKISCIIPTRNENSATTNENVLKLIKFISSNFLAFLEVIVVDDASTFAFKLENETFDSSKNIKIKVLRNSVNLGKGASIHRGVMAASGDVIVLLDADLQINLEVIVSMISDISNNTVDLAIGTRKHPKSEVIGSSSKVRKLVSFIFVVSVRLFLLPHISDTQCPLKAFRRSQLIEIFTQQRLRGYAYDAEIIYLAVQKRIKILEYPVSWLDTRANLPFFKAMFLLSQAIIDVTKVRVWYILGAYRI